MKKFMINALCVALIASWMGCGTSEVYTQLSAIQTKSLEKHRDNDKLIYDSFKKLAERSSNNVVARLEAQLMKSHTEALYGLVTQLDEIAREGIKTGLAKLEAEMLPKIDDAKEELDIAPAASKDQKKAVYADLSAVLYSAKVKLILAIIEKRDTSLKTGTEALQTQLDTTRASIRSISTEIEADLLAVLDIELEAMDDIIEAQKALDAYLNRPSALAIIIHGGLSEAGVKVSLDRLDSFVKKSSQHFRSATYRFVGSGGGDGDVFKDAFKNTFDELKDEFSDDLKQYAKNKWEEILESIKK